MNFPFGEGQFPVSIGNATDRLERPILTVSGLIDSSVIVSWEAVDTATGYLVFVNGTQEYSGSNLTFEVTGLNTWERNSIQVKAFNVDKESSFATYIKPSKALTKPVLTLVSKTDTTVSLIATNPDGQSLVELYQDGVLVSSAGNVFEWELTGLTSQQGYDYYIRTGSGQGNWSEPTPVLHVIARNPVYELLRSSVDEMYFTFLEGDSYWELETPVSCDRVKLKVWPFDSYSGLPAGYPTFPVNGNQVITELEYAVAEPIDTLGGDGTTNFVGVLISAELIDAGVTVATFDFRGLNVSTIGDATGVSLPESDGYDIDLDTEVWKSKQELLFESHFQNYIDNNGFNDQYYSFEAPTKFIRTDILSAYSNTGTNNLPVPVPIKNRAAIYDVTISGSGFFWLSHGGSSFSGGSRSTDLNMGDHKVVLRGVEAGGVGIFPRYGIRDGVVGDDSVGADRSVEVHSIKRAIQAPLQPIALASTYEAGTGELLRVDSIDSVSGVLGVYINNTEALFYLESDYVLWVLIPNTGIRLGSVVGVEVLR